MVSTYENLQCNGESFRDIANHIFSFPKAFSSLEAAEDWIDSFAKEMDLDRRAIVSHPMPVRGWANENYELHFFIYEQEIDNYAKQRILYQW